MTAALIDKLMGILGEASLPGITPGEYADIEKKLAQGLAELRREYTESQQIRALAEIEEAQVTLRLCMGPEDMKAAGIEHNLRMAQLYAGAGQ